LKLEGSNGVTILEWIYGTLYAVFAESWQLARADTADIADVPAN